MSATVTHAANKINSHSTSASCVLPTAPTSGNTLVAFVYLQQTDTNTTYTVTSGWTQVHPYQASPTLGYIWSSGPFGQLSLFYKTAGGSESATQTPVTVTTAISSAVTMYEISGLGGTFDETFKKGSVVSDLTYGDLVLGQILIDGTFPSSGLSATAGSTDTLLVLNQVLSWNTSTEFTQTSSDMGPAFANLITAVSATTTDGWPVGGVPKTAALVAFWDTVAPGTTKSLLGDIHGVYGSGGFIAFDAGVVSGGGTPGETIITTTVASPAVIPSSFRYTTISVS